MTRDEVQQVAKECGFAGAGTNVFGITDKLERFAAAMYAKGAEDMRKRVYRQPVGYVRAYALETLSKPGHTVIDSEPKAVDDIPLYADRAPCYQCIGVIDANGDIYPGTPEAGTQVFIRALPITTNTEGEQG